MLFKSAGCTAAVLLCLLFAVSTDCHKPHLRPCCFGNETISHGETALLLPDCCMTLECNNGMIKKEKFGPPGVSGCCEFGGKLYQEKDLLIFTCAKMECRRGQWIFHHLKDCCSNCFVYKYGHLNTFDKFHVDWQAPCDYALTQIGNSLTPNTVVVGYYEPCTSWAPCLKTIRFKVNPSLEIKMFPGILDEIKVNGVMYPVPNDMLVHRIPDNSESHVLMWRMDGCVYYLGVTNILVIQCPHFIDILAHASLINTLGGICGQYNFDMADDLTTRAGIIKPHTIWPLEFTDSWKTPSQPRPECKGKCVDCRDGTDPCMANNATRMEYLESCRKALHPAIGVDIGLNREVNSCASTLCRMRQNGASERERRQWIQTVFEMVSHCKLILLRVLGHSALGTPPASGECSVGGRWMESCNWCHCTDEGTKECTQNICDPDYYPALGESICIGESWWMTRTYNDIGLPSCHWCRCVRGAMNCIKATCTDGSATPTTMPPITQTFPTTTPTIQPNQSVCLLLPEKGPCHALQTRYFHNRYSGTCGTFTYGGCLGNDNNFATFEQCNNFCSGVLNSTETLPTTPTPLPARCMKPADVGPCYENQLRFYYNSQIFDCMPFMYGGCGGNDNNFMTIETCRDICSLLS